MALSCLRELASKPALPFFILSFLFFPTSMVIGLKYRLALDGLWPNVVGYLMLIK